MNNKFNILFKKIINNQSIDGDFWQQDQKQLIYEYKYFRTIKILNEYIEDPELTPVPKEIFYYILPKLKTKKNNIIKISFKELYNLLSNYMYEYSQQFKENLLKLDSYNNGNIYVAILNIDENILHEYLDNIFDFIKIDELINKINSQTTGITDSWNKNISINDRI